MNKKEANEIKKLFTPAGCAITRICGCYVDAEKNKKTELKEAFLSLQEEEAFKYFTIFRNALSGTIEKNLINMEFPLHTEAEGGTQHFLLKLRDSQLKDDAILEEFYDKVIAAYDYGENYYIILIHCAYDIPAKATDGTEMFDASDYVYEFIQCTICPVSFPRPDCVTTALQIPLKTATGTGWWKRPSRDSCSLPLTTGIRISTAFCTMPRTRKSCRIP